MVEKRKDTYWFWCVDFKTNMSECFYYSDLKTNFTLIFDYRNRMTKRVGFDNSRVRRWFGDCY